MNNSTKVGLLSSMMVLAILAFSGSANAAIIEHTMNAAGRHNCDGLIDANCTMCSPGYFCDGQPCTQYVDGTCVIGGGL